MVNADRIEKIRHEDGRIEIVPYDSTVELLAVELDKMELSYPVKPDDEGVILDYFTDLDAEIGQVESEGIRPTKEYNDQVGLAVDEFNILEDDGFIDYGKLNVRLKAILDSTGSGTFEPSVKIRWRKSRQQDV